MPLKYKLPSAVEFADGETHSWFFSWPLSKR
jgi:hypothetical protein